jgi:hypothetical protein
MVALWIVIHKSAVAFNIGAENSGEFAFKAFLGHNAPRFVRVLNRSTQYVDFRRSSRIRLGIGINSGNGGPVQIKFNRKIRTILNVFIPISMGFSQS